MESSSSSSSSSRQSVVYLSDRINPAQYKKLVLDTPMSFARLAQLTEYNPRKQKFLYKDLNDVWVKFDVSDESDISNFQNFVRSNVSNIFYIIVSKRKIHYNNNNEKRQRKFKRVLKKNSSSSSSSSSNGKAVSLGKFAIFTVVLALFFKISLLFTLPILFLLFMRTSNGQYVKEIAVKISTALMNSDVDVINDDDNTKMRSSSIGKNQEEKKGDGNNDDKDDNDDNDKYVAEILRLQNMGFTDVKKMVQALEKEQGDVGRAVQILLQ